MLPKLLMRCRQPWVSPLAQHREPWDRARAGEGAAGSAEFKGGLALTYTRGLCPGKQPLCDMSLR